MSRIFESEKNSIARARAGVLEFASRVGEPSAEEVLRWAVRSFRGRLALSLSFGNAEGVVLLDMLSRLTDPAGVRVFTIDTGFLFEITKRYRQEVAERYGVALEVREPKLSVAEQAKKYGEKLYERDPDLCCAMRKIEPQRWALKDCDAWISGIRRDQTPQRANTPLMGWEDRYGVVKVSPLAAWTAEDVEAYVEEHDVPLNPLLARGYKSIGCEPCTRPVAEDEDPRAGRWSGQEKTECGLHFAGGKVERAVS